MCPKQVLYVAYLLSHKVIPLPYLDHDYPCKIMNMSTVIVSWPSSTIEPQLHIPRMFTDLGNKSPSSLSFSAVVSHRYALDCEISLSLRLLFSAHEEYDAAGVGGSWSSGEGRCPDVERLVGFWVEVSSGVFVCRFGGPVLGACSLGLTFGFGSSMAFVSSLASGCFLLARLQSRPSLKNLPVVYVAKNHRWVASGVLSSAVSCVWFDVLFRISRSRTLSLADVILVVVFNRPLCGKGCVLCGGDTLESLWRCGVVSVGRAFLVSAWRARWASWRWRFPPT
ncbi:hypothetical protein Bca101_001077 [Brassica carinata]